MFNYHMQAAIYVDACRALGLTAKGFNFLAQEKQHPYPYVVYTLSDEALVYGQQRNQQALSLLLRCKEGEDFKPYNIEGIHTVENGDLY